MRNCETVAVRHLHWGSLRCFSTANSVRESAVTITVREELNGEIGSCCAIGEAGLRPALQRNECYQSRTGGVQRGIREAGPKPAQALSRFPRQDRGGAASAVGESTRECSDHAEVANDVGGSERGGHGRVLDDVALAMVILDHRSRDLCNLGPLHSCRNSLLPALHDE